MLWSTSNAPKGDVDFSVLFRDKSKTDVELYSDIDLLYIAYIATHPVTALRVRASARGTRSTTRDADKDKDKDQVDYSKPLEDDTGPQPENRNFLQVCRCL